MFDDFSPPNVVTKAKIGEFTLHCVAYRKLTKSELKHCAYKWLKQNHRRSFPKTGSGKIITIYGHDIE